MKFYNVEENEMVALTALDGTAAILLSLSMAFLAFYFGANWDLLLASGLPENVLSEAKATRAAAGWASAGTAALTALLIVARTALLHHIRMHSDFVDVGPK